MPDEFESYFKNFAEEENKKDIVVKLGTPSHEYPQHFSEWRTRAQLVLEHIYTDLQQLMHEYSLFGCSQNEHAAHPICKLERRVHNMLKTVSPLGAKYQTPRLHRYELGDEKPPNTPLTEGQRKTYDMIVSAVTDFEKEFMKFKEAGQKVQSFIDSEQVIARQPIQGVPVNPIRRVDGSVAVQPATGFVQELQGAVASQGVTTRIAEGRPVEITRLGFNPLEQPAEFLQFAFQLYIEQELPEWTQEFENLEPRIRNLSSEKRVLIERELREGSIAMLMPGRAVQEQTLAKAIQQLRPLWIENGQRKTVDAPFQWGYVENMVREKSVDVFQDIPNNPYILLAKPTQAPPPNTVDKTRLDQIAEFNRMQQERPELRATNVSGYFALQSWATRAQNRVGVQDIQPLDRNAWTRLIGLPVFGGSVPVGVFYADVARLKLVGYDAGLPYPDGGFRLEVMVEL